MQLLLFELRPPLLEEHGLARALQSRLGTVEARAGLVTEFQSDGEQRVRPETEQELYRLPRRRSTTCSSTRMPAGSRCGWTSRSIVPRLKSPTTASASSRPSAAETALACRACGSARNDSGAPCRSRTLPVQGRVSGSRCRGERAG